MLPLNLDRIDAAYLLGLPEAGGPAESRTLDYKQDFGRNNRDEVEGSELRADVSAFANSEGGDLVIGIAEDGAGLPAKVDGVPCPNADALKLQIDGILRTIEPKLTSYTIYPVALSGDRAVIVIRIRPSFAAPHRTGLRQGFYYRTNSGKDAMSVDQVREAFVASAGLEGRLREFRRARRDAEPPPGGAMEDGVAFIIQVMPLIGATRPSVLDVVEHQSVLMKGGIPTFSSGNWAINFDGGYSTFGHYEGKTVAYSQWFRNAFREVAWVQPYRAPREGSHAENENRIVDEFGYARTAVHAVAQTLQKYAQLDVPPPYYIGLSIRQCLGYQLGFYWRQMGFLRTNRASATQRVNELMVPEVIAEQTSADVPSILRPAFDRIANAFGISHSDCYGPNGEWKLGEQAGG